MTARSAHVATTSQTRHDHGSRSASSPASTEHRPPGTPRAPPTPRRQPDDTRQRPGRHPRGPDPPTHQPQRAEVCCSHRTVTQEGRISPEEEGSLCRNTVSSPRSTAVSYTHLRAHETVLDLVCRLLLEKKKKKKK